MKWTSWLVIFLCQIICVSAWAVTWNNPHSVVSNLNVQYAAITSSPKTLDPARAFSAEESDIIAQIYEPILQYHFLKRPYVLTPLTALSIPSVIYYDKSGKVLHGTIDPSQVSYSVYDINIKPKMYYQPHPAFAKDKQGNYLYLHLTEEQLDKIDNFSDFKKLGTRELEAADYIYQIKRLASPHVNSPIFGFMSQYIYGMQEYRKQLKAIIKKQKPGDFLDLRKYALPGVKILDRYHYQITIKGVYPQFIYWLAMTFFSPLPWEADVFYSQSGMKDRNITLNWYPIGTGPYMLVVNNPNKEIVLVANPNFRAEYYPSEGELNDRANGYLNEAGKRLPFIEKVVFILDKESIPRWNKYLQGYYDKSGVGADSFDQAIKIDKNGKPYLTPYMKNLGIKLQTAVQPGLYYVGFNMLDPVVGGYGPKKQKLRQAISIALDYDEFISIFLNGRGVPAQGPIPPTIFGYLAGEKGVNPYVYYWFDGKPVRHPISVAKQLLAEAGYPKGIDPKTQQPLILNYDVAITGNPDDKAILDWFRKQFAKIGIQLNIRATLYNRFQDKVRSGNVQIFSWGWLADYPDPENFLFLLYGPNGKVKYGGENATNYSNPKVDKLYEEIRVLPNGPERQAKINELLLLIRQDSPWVWGFHPITFTLSHQWTTATKPNPLAHNTLKYEKINPSLREKLRSVWNKPILWPLWIFIFFIIIIAGILFIAYKLRERRPAIKKMKNGKQ